MKYLFGGAALALGLVSAPTLVAANPVANPEVQVMAQGTAIEAGEFARFVPAPTSSTRLDWTVWDQALDYFVLYMGPSLRQGAPRPRPSAGTRLTYGHDSRYRMEGNRIAFELIEDDKIAALTEYRQDLERIGSEQDIATLPRNEQLAFWLNLHNVAIVEQIGLAYPVSQPRNIRIGGVRLDEAKFITIDGVAMSPHDIRTKIVYPNWNDARVIYGFFRGEIGGPSIQLAAFTGDNLDTFLSGSAGEFVNSLRGLQPDGNALRVSEIYEEGRPFYFADWSNALSAHLLRFANEDLSPRVASARSIEASIYEHDVADLSKGEREPIFTNVDECPADRLNRGFQPPGSCPRNVDVPLAVQRYTEQRRKKVEELLERGLYGRVIVLPAEGEGEEID